MRAPVLSCPRCARDPDRCRCPVGLGPLGRPFGPLAVQAAASASDLTGTQRAVLAAVARSSTGCWGVCWRSVAGLGELAGFTARTVRRILGQLVDLEVLARDTREQTTWEYRVRADWVAGVAAGATVPRGTRGGKVWEVSAAAGGGSTIRPSRIEDPPPPDRGSSDPKIDPRDRSTSPPPPPPAEGAPLPVVERPARADGSPARERWVSDRALGELSQVPGPLAVLRRYDAGERGLVETWLSWARNGTWPDAPHGLRGREVRRGLRDAARRWRAGQQADPPPLPAQLELPDGASPEDDLGARALAELGDLAHLVDGDVLEQLVAERALDLAGAGAG